MGKYELKGHYNSEHVNRVEDLLSAPETDWYLFFNDIGSLINEYNQTNYKSSTNNPRTVFFRFLKEAFATDVTKNLKENEKEGVFVLTQSELNSYSYDLNNIDDLKMLYDRFNVFLRVEHKNWSSAVLDLISNFANKVVSANIVLDKKIKDIDWHFTNFFWILNVNFSHYVNNTIDYENFKKTFDVLKKMNGEIRRWDANSVFSFRSVLGTYRIVRQNLQNNAKVCEDLDEASQSFISNIIELTKYQCFSLTEDEIKEAAYIEYVKNVSKDSKKLFSNLYKKVDKKQVFPNEYTYSPRNTRFKMTVLYQQLKTSEKNTINKAILETHRRIEDLRKKLKNISYQKPIEDQIFRLHIFNNKEHYVKYGPLWGINTAGGGYAHVRNSLEDDQSMINRPLLKNEKWYETFVYQQKGDTRNRLTKEGGNFRNLGHEVQHTLFYALMGPQGLHHLPSWMIEGAANALGNEQCFKEEADYIKNHQDILPNIERIINMSYSSGGDLYYFGSALFRFMLEKQPDLLNSVLSQAQKEKPTEEINLSIKNGLRNFEIDFKNWLIQSIETCSEVEENELKKNHVKSEQQQYQSDLSENPVLKNFLQTTPTKFVFDNTIFHLTSAYITRSSRTQTGRGIFLESPQPLMLQDYNWFKSALEIFVIQTKLGEFNSILSDFDNIIQSLVDRQGHEFSIRKILQITDERGVNLTPEQLSRLNPALEAFVFQSVDLSPNLKKRYDALNSQQKSDPLQSILKKLIHSSAVCEDYLNKVPSQKGSLIEMLSDQPVQSIKIKETPMLDKSIKNAYRKQLKQNNALSRLIKKHGAVHFIFKDTSFALTKDNINRYDLDGNPQLLSSGDFEWFESALEVFFIRIFFNKRGLDLSDEDIAKLLYTHSEYVSNRQIQNMVPLENACLRLMVQDFVLNSNLSNLFKYRLMQFGYEMHQQPETPALDNRNAASVLGALTLMVSNASLILNSLTPASPQIAQHKDESCENDIEANNFYWFLTGGVLVTAGIILLLGFFLGYKINKAKETPLVKKQGKTLSLERPLDTSLESEVNKLEGIKEALRVLECRIEKDFKRNNIKVSCQKKVIIIINNLDYLINLVKNGFNPAVNNKETKAYVLYRERINETQKILKELKENFRKFRKNFLVTQADSIVTELRCSGVLPALSNAVADHEETYVTIDEQNISQNNKVLRYTPQPTSTSTFKKISWLFNGTNNSRPPLASELQVMVDENDSQNGEKEPTYANVKSIGGFFP